MANIRGIQPSFTAGELSPALHARVDLAKYSTGLKAARNLFVHPHGGVSNRAGLEFVRAAKTNSLLTVTVPFEFNTEQTYTLEFGGEYIRFFTGGAIILDGSDAIYEIETPYLEAHLNDLVYVQEADVMYITHHKYAPRKLSRLADDEWSLEVMTFEPAIAAPGGLSASAIFTVRDGASESVSYAVTAVDASGNESAASSAVTATMQFENDDGRLVRVAWNASAGANTYRVYRTDAENGMLAEVTETHVDLTQAMRFGDGGGAPGSADAGAPDTPTGVSANIRRGYPIKYKVAAIDDDTGEESLPSDAFTIINDLDFAGNKNILTCNERAGASGYIWYKQYNGKYGYIGRSDTPEFTDENITADVTDGPQKAYNPFNGVNKYPRCATFMDQRLMFASTNREPQAVWGSQTGNYENFGSASPVKASDGFKFRIRSRKVNEIRAMIPSRGLMVLTSGSENIVSGGAEEYLNPTNIVVKTQGYRGCAEVQPIAVGETVLFAQARGGVIRDFAFEFAQDAFTGKDLTIMSRHLFEDRTIKAWAYAQAPSSMVWVVLDNGALVSLTYMKEHDVWGWTRHETDGEFLHVSVVAEGQEDVPYFLIKRTIGGEDVVYLERLHTRTMATVEDAFFVDSGLSYSGAATATVAGLEHLEGRGVVALVNGNVVRGLTVSGGAVELPHAGTKIHVGLPYEAMMRTLDLEMGQVQGLGTVQGRKASVSEVTLRVDKTRGIWIGNVDGTRESGSLIEFKQRAIEAWSDAIGLYSGDLSITPPWDWTNGGNMVVKQFDPLPMTVLAVMPDVVIGK